MIKIAGIAALLVGMSMALMAIPPDPVPEIGASTSMSAVALLLGGVLVIRGRRKKKGEA